MKTIQVDLYQFAELEETAQQKAIEAHRYINVDDDDWWDFIYDDFIGICEAIGISVDKPTIFFQSFYAQGDGSGFVAEINLPELLDSIAIQKWKAYAPKLELDLTVPDIDRRVLKLIQDSKLDASPKSHIHIEATMLKQNSMRTYRYSFHGYPLIEKQLDLLEDGLIKIAETLNRFLYKSLQNEYEYRTEELAVTEAIEANDYWFTADGERANRLESLSFKSSLETNKN